MGQQLGQKVVIPSILSEAHRVLDRILDQVKGHGYSDDAYFAIRLAMDEALTNAVRHGNCCDTSKKIVVEYSVTDEAFRATIEDEGCGFEAAGLPDPTEDENIERPCGRGVMLMKAYMSDVRYNPCGNRVTLTKYRDCPLPARSRR